MAEAAIFPLRSVDNFVFSKTEAISYFAFLVSNFFCLACLYVEVLLNGRNGLINGSDCFSFSKVKEF